MRVGTLPAANRHQSRALFCVPGSQRLLYKVDLCGAVIERIDVLGMAKQGAIRHSETSIVAALQQPDSRVEKAG